MCHLLKNTLSFNGFGQEASKNAPYVIASLSRPEEGEDVKLAACRVWQHMRGELKLYHPKLMISVTGGAKRFEMKKRHLKSFKRGLMKAATTSNAWIITGGTKNGVMEFVGDAVKEYMLENGAYEQQLVVMGIATLGAVVHCDELLNECQTPSSEGSFMYSPPTGSTGKKALLDPQHTHFILVDDGTREVFGKEIAFRAAFEQHDHSTAGDGPNGDYDCQLMGVPVVMLVLEGGINTLQTACEAIEKNTPIIILQGSGRAADFVVRAQAFIDSSDEEGLRNESLTLVSEKEVDKATKFVKILHHPTRKHLMTVFHQSEDTSGDELAEAILKALLRASLHSARQKKQATNEFLELALSFNRCDIAKKEIFNLEKKSEIFNPSNLNEPFMTALIENKFDFVQLFLDLGVEIKSFLDYAKLNDLYKNILLNVSASSSAEVIKCLLSDTTKDKNPDNILIAVGKAINALTEDQFIDLYKDSIGHMNVLLENPDRELFFWCILLNFQEMARIFWKTGIDYIGGALTASRIMSSLSLVALNRLEEFELSRQLKEEANKFEEEAKCILNECYSCNGDLAKNLMVRSLSTWGNKTLFDLSNDAFLMNFSEHDCCQAKLNYIWYGRMKSYTSVWMVVLGLFFPFIVVHFIEFRESDELNQVVPVEDMSDVSSTDSSVQIMGKLSSKLSISSDFTVSHKNSRCCGKYFRNLYSFFSAPIVKFGYFTISYLVFLSIFSYFVMIDLEPLQVSTLEVVTWMWIITLGLDEIRQCLTMDAPTFRMKLSKYIGDPWNVYDQVIDFLMIIVVILRYTLQQENFSAVRMLYSLTLLLCILRLLKLFYIHQYVGPKVIMIQKVMLDLMFFVMIFGVFLFAYGIAAQSLLYPNSEPSWLILKNIVYRPYFTLFGQFNFDELLGQVSNCVTNQTLYQSNPFQYPLCSNYSWMAMILFAIYAIMVCTMLVNLLVAIFSFTFTSIQETALRTWQFHRISIIREFFEKPALAPPLIIFSHIFMIIRYCFSFKKEKNPIKNDFRMEYEDLQNKRLGAFERRGMENHIINKRLELKNNMDFKVTTTNEKTEIIVGQMENVKEYLYKKTLKRSTNNATEDGQKPRKFIKELTNNFNHSLSKPVVSRSKKHDNMEDRIDQLEKLIQEQSNLIKIVYDLIIKKLC